MKPSMRRTLAMSALGLAAGAVLGRLSYDHLGASVVVAWLVAAGVLALTVPPAVRRLDQIWAAVAAHFRGGAAAVVPLFAARRTGVVGRLLGQTTRHVGEQSAHAGEGDRRRATQAQPDLFAQREQILVGVVESASWPIITEALDGTITAWNAAAERLYKFTAAEAVGNSIDIVIPPERREERQAILDRALADKPIESFETIRMDR